MKRRRIKEKRRGLEVARRNERQTTKRSLVPRSARDTNTSRLMIEIDDKRPPRRKRSTEETVTQIRMTIMVAV